MRWFITLKTRLLKRDYSNKTEVQNIGLNQQFTFFDRLHIQSSSKGMILRDLRDMCLKWTLPGPDNASFGRQHKSIHPVI